MQSDAHLLEFFDLVLMTFRLKFADKKSGA
jgi:hypothetical protein